MEDILLFRKLMRTKIGQHDSIPLMRDVKEGINREVRILPESKVVPKSAFVCGAAPQIGQDGCLFDGYSHLWIKFQA